MIAPLTCFAVPVQSALIVSPDLVSVHLEGDRHADADPVVVDVVEEVVDAVGQLAERGAGHALGVVDELGHVFLEFGVAVARGELDQRRLGDVAGGELGAQIAEHLHRHSHIGLDQREQRFVALAALVELQRRDAQPLLVDLGQSEAFDPGTRPPTSV